MTDNLAIATRFIRDFLGAGDMAAGDATLHEHARNEGVLHADAATVG